MSTTNFKIHIILNQAVIYPSEKLWYAFLSNIYGLKSNNFDGYVSRVEYSNSSILIECYLVDDIKLRSLKEKYLDWYEFQKILILDATKLHLNILGYSMPTIEIT
jgi:hypothetical protein